ncbi:CDP-alcohol phosphatidyltransferase family protein [Roseibacterium sp. SDUM158017]|uniref:CDP-alcohol phosphatidyltransferase family protein n=1 Tax=Roseicyclus salinarum TaxID=3036773 RepID=UPI0024157E6A|nr:CDP-alcohol phosphatidyltransferase family protein [Roseibacterium sp. SDUM158017]MDG4647785.1 CDP-alcohol phosphatidyltransferase family protein [Roseibacterium sp. SDUM158017]
MTLTNFDRTRAAHRRLPLLPAQGPAGDFARAALAGAVATLVLAAALTGWDGAFGAGLAAGMAVYAAAAFAAALEMHRRYPHPVVGLCNLVTLLRLVLAASLVPALVAGTGPGWGLFAVAVVALSLDGADGWLARRQGLVSHFGARFDMEVDSLLGLILATMAWTSGNAPAAVILLGLPRYVFGAAGLVLPWLRRDLPERFSRKAVCVVQLATLIVLQLPIVPQGLSAGLVTLAAGALAWSFARDVIWLRQARA